MKRVLAVTTLIALAATVHAQGRSGEKKTKPVGPRQAVSKPTPQEKTAKSPTGKKKEPAMIAPKVLARYQKELARLEKAAALAHWEAANSGKEEDFAKTAEARLALRKFHSDPRLFKKMTRLLENRDQLDPLDARALEIAVLAMKGNQLSPEMLGKMVALSTEIEQIFNTFRGTLDGKSHSNNDLLEMLSEETDSERRKAIWETLKQTGGAVGPKLVELAKLRNEAAVELGYRDYWDMEIRLQEHDPAQLLAIFDELEELTDEPFTEMKKQLDAELSRRFKIAPEDMRAWHYDNPFFQAAPPSEAVDLDEFYEKKAKEDIAALAVTFYGDIGMPIEDIVARSDLYEREGKDQHAFCTDIDREGDVRTLCNLKPTAEWMDTMLHEQGHAVYDKWMDRSLPFNLRRPAHIFFTEAVAMLMGACGKNPTWMIGYAGADPDRIKEVEKAIYEQRRREQLIFARWTMVMLNFEKALYADPDRDLNTLWWDLVERFQQIPRPTDRDEPDWAAKPHFTIAPVYYHNYMLGELFAAQLRNTLAQRACHKGPTATLSFNGREDFGKFLKQEVFAPGASKHWPKLVEDITGEPLGAKRFSEEVE